MGQDEKQNEIFISYTSRESLYTMTIKGKAREIARALASNPATTVEYRDIIEHFQKAYNEPDLKPNQVEAVVRKTPFASLAKFVPKDRSELYAFVALLLTILQIIISLRTSSNEPTITPDQVEEIIDRVLDHHQRDAPPSEPPASPVPPSEHK